VPVCFQYFARFSQKTDRFTPFLSFPTCILGAIRPIVSQRRIFKRMTRIGQDSKFASIAAVPDRAKASLEVQCGAGQAKLKRLWGL
jgi:hypothetical protein